MKKLLVLLVWPAAACAVGIVVGTTFSVPSRPVGVSTPAVEPARQDEDPDADVQVVPALVVEGEGRALSSRSSLPVSALPAQRDGNDATADDTEGLGERDRLPVEVTRKLITLRNRVAWLEVELALCGSDAVQSALGGWLEAIRPEERPDPQTIRQVGWYLADYPIKHLSIEEGLWLVERVRRDDWLDWGGGTNEAIILFLDPRRIAREVPPERLVELRERWAEEGYFDQ